MKTFLFLDDWMLDSQRDVVRRFGRPEPVKADPVPFIGNYATVLYDPDPQRRYKAARPVRRTGCTGGWTPSIPSSRADPSLGMGSGTASR